jgi:hypothetical protein
VGDHGEAHWEHYELERQFTDSRPNYGVGHGGTPFDLVARVPAGVGTPDGNITPRGGHGSLVDLPATLCREVLTGALLAERAQAWQTPIPENRTVLCEATRYGAERKAVYREGVKLIRSETDDVTVTSRLTGDAGDSFDGSMSDDEAQSLLDELPDYWADGRINADTSRMVEDQLSALGYT